MTKISRALFVSFVLSGVAACAPTIVVSGTQIAPQPAGMRARPADAVEVFASGPPQRPFRDVYLLTAEARNVSAGNDVPDERFLLRLKQQAGASGCDGIVLVSTTVAMRGANQAFKASCIVYE